MRISSSCLLVAVALGGCTPEVNQPQAEEGALKIECALGEGSQFGPDCLIERTVSDGQTIVTVRHPDGGFRRFEQLDDGRGLAEVDGADVATRSLEDDTLLITVGEDQYRFAATRQQAGDAAE